MSTFSGLSTALTSLNAQRQAMEVTSQNISNANTTGYTRQRASMSSIAETTAPSMWAASRTGVGDGVSVTSVQRLNDEFLTARVRSATSDASYLSARSTAYSTVESSIADTGSDGLTAQLSSFWKQWSDVSSTVTSAAGGTSSAGVLLNDANDLTNSLHTMYSSVDTQWSDTHTQVGTLVDQVNATATSVAQLNRTILSLTSSGQSANELADQRDTLITTLSSLTGATTQTDADGQIDVYVGGTAIVDGGSTRTLQLTGATTLAQTMSGGSTQLTWAGTTPTQTASVTGGQIGGLMSALAPAQSDGSGGILAQAATSLNTVASTLISSVNALHSTAVRTDGSTPGGNFFAGTGAADISVAITQPSDVAVAAAGKGALDGTVGQQIAALAHASGGPDATWAGTLTAIGSAASTANSRSTVATSAQSSLEDSLSSETSVDTDEETVNLLAYQRAYQASAKVISTIDQMVQTVLAMVGT